MGWIWNVILSFGDEEYWEENAEEALENCPALDKINSWLEADKVHNRRLLTDLTAGATGNGTGMSANIWGGGFRHFDMEEFIAVVERQQWRDRASVQLFVQGEEDSKFTVIELGEQPQDTV